MGQLCVWCGRSFQNDQKLKRHEQLQHYIPRFECGLCPSTFSNKHSRRRHVANQHGHAPHTEEFRAAVASEAKIPRPCPMPMADPSVAFPCAYCSTNFASHSDFIDHMVNVHNIDQNSSELDIAIKPLIQKIEFLPISRNFTCGLCSSLYPNSHTLKQHLIEIHGIQDNNTEHHNVFNQPIINGQILQETTPMQQNQIYQTPNIPDQNFYYDGKQGNTESYYDMTPTPINAPILQKTLMQQNQIYRPPDIPVENIYQATSFQTPCTLNNEQYQTANPYNLYFNNTHPDHDSQKMSNCIVNSERTKLKDITVSGTNVVESSFKDFPVIDNMNVLKNSVIHNEGISPYASNSTSIQMSNTTSSVQHQNVNVNVIDSSVHDTNVLKNSSIHTEEILPYTSNLVPFTHNEKKPIKCPVCNAFFEANCYGQHTQSDGHKLASEIHFKDRIDFESNIIFSNSTCATVSEFLSAISEDFNILVNHLLLLKNAILVDLSFTALFCNKNLVDDDRNIVTSKYFSVQNKELTKDTDLCLLYDCIEKSLMTQCDNVLKKNSGWAMDEIVNLEIIMKNHEIDMQPMSRLSDSNSNETGNFRKNVSLQLSKCKICKLYMVQRNYEQHVEIISHQIAMFYLNNTKITVNPDIDNLQDCFLNCRFLPDGQMSLNNFLYSIEFELLNLIYRVLELKLNNSIKVDLKLLAIYNSSGVQNEINNFNLVKTFTITNEVIHRYTTLSVWYQHILTLFESNHQEHIRNSLTRGQHSSLVCVFYLDIDFYDVGPNILL